MGLVFEWDGKKAESNKRKGGVTFGEAATIFGDVLIMIKSDTRDPTH